ncbi:MAG: hypothetical protein Q8Q01_04175 [archaeon]|nr:hypothetical protein [archaeon]
MRLLTTSILLVLILLPFAFATTLKEPIGFANNQFQVSGQCDNPNVKVGLQVALGINTVLVSETVANNLKAYTFLVTPIQDGTYTFVVACAGENSQQGEACVGVKCQQPQAANFCGDGNVADGEECDDGNRNDADACDNQCKLNAGPPPGVAPGPSGGGGGGGSDRQPNTRTGIFNECSDFKDNDNDTLIDYPDDPGCLTVTDDTEDSEDCRSSWVCTEWNDCRNNFQVRTCNDINNCEIPLFKPIEQQSCGTTLVQPPQVPRQPIVTPSVEESFFSKYGVFIWGGLLLLILLAALILAILYFKNRKKVAYNINDLKQWIAKEKAAGASKEEIKDVLSEKTGWDDEELVNVFKELNGGTKKK